MKCNTLSIFTPTYNRAYILSELYESLVKQTDKNFEWILVDDGSTDNTSELVNKWILESKITIRYIKQKNQGKHIAINTGIEQAEGELFFIVDSDDRLTPNAVETVRDFWNSFTKNEDYSGIISYRLFPDGRLVGTPLPTDLSHCKLRECNAKYGSVGDKVVIYRTDIFSQYRYPQFENERFFGESYVFNMIDDEYDMLIMENSVYVFDYQKDGLSQDFRKLYRNNPNGMRVSMIQALKYDNTLKIRLKTLAHIGCLSIGLHDMKEYFKVAPLWSTVMALPLAVALYIKIFKLKASDVKPYMATSEGVGQ